MSLPYYERRIEQGKYKPCLEYHLHNCGAPCINKQSYEDYQEAIKQAREVLKGNTRDVQKTPQTRNGKVCRRIAV